MLNTNKYLNIYIILIVFYLNFISILTSNIILPIKQDPYKFFYYYITLYFGSQKTPQSFILDTTSSLISSPCNLCTSCGYHSNEYYNITNPNNEVLSCDDKCTKLSGTCNEKQCGFKYDYYENMYYKGVYVNQNIYFNKNSEKPYELVVGCTLNETNYLIAQEPDGIMGINNDDNSFINMLYKHKIIQNNLFSICLNRSEGYLSLGNTFNKNEMKYIDYEITQEKYYKINIDSLVLNDKNYEINNYAIIDSTATLSAFPEKIFEELVDKIIRICTEDKCGKLIKNKNYGLCANFKDNNEMINMINNWPVIKINFKKNIEYIWRPDNYWINITSDVNYRACFGFESTSENFITLGFSFMRGYNLIFDKENTKIWMEESDCNENQKKSNKTISIITTNLKEGKNKINIIKITTIIIITIIILMVISKLLYNLIIRLNLRRKGFKKLNVKKTKNMKKITMIKK